MRYNVKEPTRSLTPLSDAAPRTSTLTGGCDFFSPNHLVPTI